MIFWTSVTLSQWEFRQACGFPVLCVAAGICWRFWQVLSKAVVGNGITMSQHSLLIFFLVFRKPLLHGSTKEAVKSIWSLGLLSHMARLNFQQGIHLSVEYDLHNKTHINSFCLRPRIVSLIISVVYEQTDSLILISCRCTYSGKSEIKYGLRKYSINAAAINVIAMPIIRNTKNT